MSEKLESETPTMRQRLVRLRVGARFWMDFRGWTWPDCPHGDADLVFAAFRSGVDNKSTLRGQGFGNPRPHYGNGSILAEDSDLIDLPNDKSPPEPETVAKQEPCSALQRALDDGQEIKIHRFWNPRDQRNEYHVRIYGDHYVEAERTTLNDAITDAAKLYLEWVR